MGLISVRRGDREKLQCEGGTILQAVCEGCGGAGEERAVGGMV